MATTTAKKSNSILKNLVNELKVIKGQLRKLLILIPEESLKDYDNGFKIEKAYRNATEIFTPK